MKRVRVKLVSKIERVRDCKRSRTVSLKKIERAKEGRSKVQSLDKRLNKQKCEQLERIGEWRESDLESGLGEWLWERLGEGWLGRGWVDVKKCSGVRVWKRIRRIEKGRWKLTYHGHRNLSCWAVNDDNKNRFGVFRRIKPIGICKFKSRLIVGANFLHRYWPHLSVTTMQTSWVCCWIVSDWRRRLIFAFSENQANRYIQNSNHA